MLVKNETGGAVASFLSEPEKIGRMVEWGGWWEVKVWVGFEGCSEKPCCNSSGCQFEYARGQEFWEKNFYSLSFYRRSLFLPVIAQAVRSESRRIIVLHFFNWTTVLALARLHFNQAWPLPIAQCT